MTAQEMINIKAAIKAECRRRAGYGSLTSTAFNKCYVGGYNTTAVDYGGNTI